MNLVIDDAVEVHLATKDKPERRRQLGLGPAESNIGQGLIGQQDKFYSKAITSL